MRGEEVLGILLSLTALSSYLNYRFVKFPKSIGLTGITLILSVIIVLSGKLGWDVDGFSKNLLDGIGFDDTFLKGTLGFLIFAASLHVNTREMYQYKTIIALFATLSVLLSALIIGFASYALTLTLGMRVPVEYCMVFGALISPTDPIATLAILKIIKVPRSIEVKISGEALFNDGMSIVLFVLLLGIATNTSTVWTVPEITLFFVQQCVG